MSKQIVVAFTGEQADYVLAVMDELSKGISPKLSPLALVIADQVEQSIYKSED